MVKTNSCGRSDTRPGSAARLALRVELPAELSRWVDDFDHHLSHVVGLAPASRRQYCFFVRRFLAEHAAAGMPERRALFAEWLTAFVRHEAARLHGHSRNKPGTAMRAWLRYLVFRGVVDAGLDAAIPSLPRWKHASLPVHLTVEETERVIVAALDSSPHELRNHAIVLILARMGLRACEVRHLMLDDIDWAQAYIRIGPGKSHRERRLPVPRDVGEALCAYLQHERPASHCRAVFLSSTPPFGQFATPR
ncbi:tyrosine-type recombinase/integrase [Paraburkholderia sp. LEh10]|nr:tyrosine-type recombinase/integrase [Paraburkholderia sp. LEh10]